MFHLFEGDLFYACGGINDYTGTHETLEAAKAAVKPESEWAHVAAMKDGRLICVAHVKKSRLQHGYPLEWADHPDGI